MVSEEKVRGIAPAVLIVALLLLALVPLPALAAEGTGGNSLAYELDSDRTIEPAIAGEPVDILDVKEVIQGMNPGEQFGAQTAGIGDVDNDGYSDIAVLIPARGYCMVYLGGTTLRESLVHPLANAGISLSAQSQIRPAGDIDSDGFDDVLITAPDLYVSGMRAAGAVFIFYGSPSGLRELPDQVIFGTEKDMRLGSDVDGVGDFNQDGYDDILVGADGWNEDTGMVRLYLGGADGLYEDPVWIWEGESKGDRFGHAVTGAGDLNADGYLDFAVSSPFANAGEGIGCVYIFYGLADLAGLEVGDTVGGRMLKSYYGLSIRLAGDVNNDGFSDLIISAPKEPNGPINPGKVELYLGSEHGIGTDPPPDWYIEGESDDALLGFTIAFLGDVNRDGYDDVAIGAPGHSSEGKPERGKVYIYLGAWNGFRDAPSIVELGPDPGDHMSAGLAGAGDIDGDGFNDVLVGAPGADSSLGINVGELNIYRGSDLTLPPLQKDAFQVMDLEEGGLILAEYRSYQFRLSVTHRTGFAALDHVDLHLDPEGEDVVFRFNRETQNLLEISDEADLGEGRFAWPAESGSYWDTTDIMLNIKLHWGFPTGRSLSVRVEVTDNHGLRTTGRWSNTARVVDSLTFDDSIRVTADRQGELASGDWVASSEGLTFTGTMVQYDLTGYDGASTSPYYPPTGKVVVVVRDDTGGEWSQLAIRETPIAVSAVTPSTSRPEMTYTISIETADRNKVFSTEQYLLNVDGTGVNFRNHEPSDPIASLDHIVSIEIEDPLGPGVGRNVYYQLYRANDTRGWGEWTKVESLTAPDENGAVVAEVQELFTEGKNYIRWRATDLVGNGPTLSFNYTIEVDLGSISFSAPVPTLGTWHSTETVAVGITIENTQANPIDLGHIQYRTSTSPGDYSPWVTFTASLPPGAEPHKVTIVTQVRMDEGKDNYIQWRARDLERREYITSPLYRVQVDLTGPVFSEASPSEDLFINSPAVEVTVVVDDILSGVMEETISYRVVGDDIWQPPLSRTHRGEIIECSARVSLVEGVDNYIQWKAEDAMGHLSGSFYQRMKVDLSAPSISYMVPGPEEIVTDRSITTIVRVSDNGPLTQVSGVDLSTLEYAVSRPSTEGYGQWIHPEIEDELIIVEFAIIEVTIEVDHGDQNFILWRFSDASVPEGSANTFQTEPLRIVADLPDNVITIKPIIRRSEPSSPKVAFGSAVVFDASGSYHEGGEFLSFVWESDIDGVIGRSSSFSTHLSKGIHTITLTVTADDSGATSSQIFQVSVEDLEEETTPFSALWEQIALILIVAFVVLALLIQRGRRKR